MAALTAYMDTARVMADGRNAARRTLQLEVQGTTPAGRASNVLIHNMSETGLLIETAAPLAIGDSLQVVMPDAGALPAVVVWVGRGFFGCRFENPVPTATVSAALLRAPVPSPPPADGLAPEESYQHKLPLGARTMIIVGLAVLCWTVVLSAGVLLIR